MLNNFKNLTQQFALGAMLSILSVNLAKADVLVLIHPEVQADSISSTTLSRIYAMQIKKWPDGTPIRVYTFSPKTALFKEFATKKAKIQPHQLDRLWNRLLFTGTGRTPTEVTNSAEMIEKIKNNPGAIGYVDMPQQYLGLKVVEVAE